MGDKEVPYIITEGNMIDMEAVIDKPHEEVQIAYYYKRVSLLNKRITDLNNAKDIEKK